MLRRNKYSQYVKICLSQIWCSGTEEKSWRDKRDMQGKRRKQSIWILTLRYKWFATKALFIGALRQPICKTNLYMGEYWKDQLRTRGARSLARCCSLERSRTCIACPWTPARVQCWSSCSSWRLGSSERDGLCRKLLPPSRRQRLRPVGWAADNQCRNFITITDSYS